MRLRTYAIRAAIFWAGIALAGSRAPGYADSPQVLPTPGGAVGFAVTEPRA